MKRFMETNTITHNLMSFSGFKSLLIFSLLTESPKSYNELKTALEANEYLKETVSIDTIRIYMNSLALAGCNVKKIRTGKQVRYYIDSNPFELKISDEQVKSIIKVYKAIAKTIELSDFLNIQHFFDKIAPYITNDILKEKLKNISPISNIQPELIKQLMKYTELKKQIRILYYSKSSGEKEIDLMPEKLNIINGKLYLSGHSFEYNNYASFLVSDIRKIIGVNINQIDYNPEVMTVRYEYLKNDNTDLILRDNEKIIEQTKNSAIIEVRSEDKFMITQRIMALSNRCRVIFPENYKEEIISKLKKMKECYIES